jgi:hypothetical protein
VHTVEPLVIGPNGVEDKITISKLKKHKSPGSYQVEAHLIQAEGEIIVSTHHKLINSIWNNEELRDQLKEYIILPTYKKR